MPHFADRLIAAVRQKGTSAMVGLDPRIDQMPRFITDRATARFGHGGAAVRHAIANYHGRIIATLADMVPIVKPQLAFYEQYGLPGLAAYADTVQAARRAGLLVLADGKRNDIASTAEAYAHAFLGAADALGRRRRAFQADALTVNPYLGGDSLEPFLAACARYGKGIFVLVKTSNPGSGDLQDLSLSDGQPLYMAVAAMVSRYGKDLVGKSGYSLVGAVVGATHPEQASELRAALPQAIILVPGYGAQGGSAGGAARCFHKDGLGAIVNASRSLTYGFDPEVGEAEWASLLRRRAEAMAADLRRALNG